MLPKTGAIAIFNVCPAYYSHAYLGEFDERHVVVEEKILEHLGSAHLGRAVLCLYLPAGKNY